MSVFPPADLALARRLESAEALANVAFVEARARHDRSVGATWIEIAGARAMFDGVDSPLTQTFGLGLFETVDATHLDRIESFFRDRHAAVCHEVSPLAGAALLRTLGDRGYHVSELTTVLYQPIDVAMLATRSHAIYVQTIDPSRGDEWAEIAAQGWSSEAPGLVDFVRGLGHISVRARNTTAFLATLRDRPIAAAALSINNGVALLAGASTVPAARRQGAQQALLEARLRFAHTHDCDLAMMCAAPGSTSQRNAERRGFRVAYTRVKWETK